jgi:internalin A
MFLTWQISALLICFNQITELPPELGQLTKLDTINVADNPLISPPPAIVSQGSHAILQFLRGRLEKTIRQWVSKLIIVGEGGVGKTQLLRHLRNEVFDRDIPTTHGIEIHPCRLPHPTDPSIVMLLNAWDFGGQQIYHATHQFFLTQNSLFLLVWNARLGFEQGKLFYWLDTIRVLAPDSPVLLVATHIDERQPDLPLKDLQSKYQRLSGQVAISNLSGLGISTLKGAVADLAIKLPLMGEPWPATWFAAASALRDRSEKFFKPAQMWSIMKQHDVKKGGHSVLAQWLHELGDILYFPDDPELYDIVILKPQWVSSYISMVLDDAEVAERTVSKTTTGSYMPLADSMDGIIYRGVDLLLALISCLCPDRRKQVVEISNPIRSSLLCNSNRLNPELSWLNAHLE